jgi:hypothetical protein
MAADEGVIKSQAIKTNCVEMMEIVFPKHTNGFTILENPILKNSNCSAIIHIDCREEKITTLSPKPVKTVATPAEILRLLPSWDLLASYI